MLLQVHCVFVGIKVVVVNPFDDLGSAIFGSEVPGVCFVTLLKLSYSCPSRPK